MFTGGGTAGHLFPCIAVAEQVRKAAPDAELLFIGTRRRLDAELLPRYGYPFESITAEGFPYGFSLRAAGSAVSLVRGFTQSRGILKRFGPAVTFAAGGYVAAAVIPAARSLGIPTVIHASDAMPDRANRFVSRWATRITVAWPAAQPHFPLDRTECTGQPLREELFRYARGEARRLFDLREDRFTLLVTGGSQGARRLNTALLEALPGLLAREDIQVLHLSGAGEHGAVAAQAQAMPIPADRYRLLPYSQEMGAAMRAADLVVMRCGASSVSEAAAFGLPMILVPLPHAGGHQRLNAEPMAAAGAGILVEDSALDGQKLAELVLNLRDDPARLAAMGEASQRCGRPDAAKRIAEIVLEVAG